MTHIKSIHQDIWEKGKEYAGNFKIISKGYDLLDVIYFRNFKKSPRKAVLDRIYENEKILDLCTGTATNAITIAKGKTNAKIITEANRVLKDGGEIIITEWEPSKQLSKRILFAPIHYLEPKPYRKFIKMDLYSYFEKYGLSIQEDIH